MQRSIWFALAVAGLVGGLAASASADDRYRPIPSGPGQTGQLELRVMQYDKGVYGEMTVEIHNRGAQPASFSASGLYFTPDDDPDSAPQRLAIVGGVRTGSEEAPRAGVALAGDATLRIRFDVYCIDEDRDAPESDTPFTLARSRMPPRLIAALEASTRDVVKTIKLKPDDDQRRQLQPLVWQARRSAPAKLVGDGAQERGKY